MMHVRRRRLLRRFFRAGEGLSSLEYAMVVGFMAVAAAAALLVFSGEITAVLERIGLRVPDLVRNLGT